MYLCDANIWVAMAIEPHEHGESVREWLASVGPEETIWFCRVTQQSFLRLVSTAAVLSPYGLEPLTNAHAWDAYEALIRDNRIALRVDDPPGLDRRWKEYSQRRTASPKLWMDAYLAAFAQTTGYRLVTTDGAFRQFEGLDLVLLGEDSKA
ncbi:MAG TPA: TA system VapC family ribonuclease toxin [Dehalococcoidia bacterium]|nr:TA system VapC family ribonuclease toxin [Dehalococcoidia bacterium]